MVDSGGEGADGRVLVVVGQEEKPTGMLDRREQVQKKPELAWTVRGIGLHDNNQQASAKAREPKKGEGRRQTAWTGISGL